MARLRKIVIENRLFDLDVAGVYIWQLLQNDLFLSHFEKAGIRPLAESKRFNRFQRRWLDVKRALVEPQKILSGLFKGRKAKNTSQMVDTQAHQNAQKLINGPQRFEILIFRFDRLFGNKYELTSGVESEFGDKVLVIGNRTSGLHGKSELGTGVLMELIRQQAIAELSNEEKAKLVSHVQKICKAFDADPAIIEKIAMDRVKLFRKAEAFFLNLYQNKGASKVCVCWNPLYFPIISAAQKLGIATFELQHGSITRTHAHYSWPEDTKPAYYPDEIQFFGSAWYENTPLPKMLKRVIRKPHHLALLQQEHGAAPKDEKLVVVASQGIIGCQLFRFINVVAGLRPDLQFVFKLHPAERYRHIGIYADGPVNKNITVIEGSGNTYAWMARARYLMGVSSTVLQEGLVFGNRVVVVKLPSHEQLEAPIFEGLITLAEDPQQAAELLSAKTPLCNDASRYFFGIEPYRER